MFYNKDIGVYELRSVENDWGVTVEDEYFHVKDLVVDIQPYSKEKLEKDYGYKLETTKRLFYDLDASLNESSIITYEGNPYKVVNIERWDDYVDMALINAVGVDLFG